MYEAKTSDMVVAVVILQEPRKPDLGTYLKDERIERMAKRKTVTKWVMDEGKDLVVRMYVSDPSEYRDRRSMCLTVVKMPERLMKHEYLMTRRIPPQYGVMYSVKTGNWSPSVGSTHLGLPNLKDRVGKSSRCMVYGGMNAALKSYDIFKIMVKELGGQVIGKGERLTTDPDKEEKLKVTRMRRRIKKPKKQKIFNGKSLASLVDNTEQEESESSIGNISHVIGAGTIEEV